MSQNTKSLTINGLFWNTLDRFGNQAIVSIVAIITARILIPEDFGVVAALTIFSTIATAIVDSGLATSLVRSKVVLEEDYSSMFVFNLIISAALYLILFLAAPYIEIFQKIDGLALYARVLFLQILINSFGIVQYVKILRNFQFQITARVNVLSVFFSGLIAIGLAVFGFGVWALLLQPVLNTLFRVILFWVWGDWKLSFHYSPSFLKRHVSFSLSFMASNMLGKILSPLYYTLIGRSFDVKQLGYYYNGNKWGETPNMLISSIIQGTTLSTLTPIQDDFARYLNACRKTMSSLVFVLFPVCFLAISVAKPAFVYFLTDAWLPSVVYFQLLCFAGIFISLTDLNVNFLNIKGRSKFALYLEIFKIWMAIICYFFTYKHGLLYVIYGLISVRIMAYLVASILSGNVYGYSLKTQITDVLPSLLISLIAAVLSYLPAYYHWVSHDLLLIIVQCIIFVIVYTTINHIQKNTIWIEILGVIKSKVSKKV